MALFRAHTRGHIVAEINVTPLTDVFLVLLIIFMVTSTAIVESEVASRTGVKVALPKANAAGPVTKKRTDPVLTVTDLSGRARSVGGS